MINPAEMTNEDFERAYRAARAHGMAERARVFRGILTAASGAVRGLFSQPANRAKVPCAEC